MKKQFTQALDISKMLRSESVGVAEAGTRFFWQEVEEVLPQLTGYTFRGLTLKKQEEGWFAVVKVWNRQKEPLVAFVAAPSAGELWRSIAGQVSAGVLRWSPDKYA
jgi:hypothetical protein